MRSLAAAALAALSLACGTSGSKNTCDPAAATACSGGLVCEQVSGGAPGCFAPLLIRGTVSDASNGAGLNGARVVALDPGAAPLSTVAVSANGGSPAADGHYQLTVRATRDATGAPLHASTTLRADAQGYQTFPSGVRVALPIDLSSATYDGGTKTWGIAGPLTNVKLLAISGGTAWIHGSVARPPSGAGVLVVAEPAPGGAGPQTGHTGVADDGGNYAIFNLAPGTPYVVTAYTAGSNYVPVTTASLLAGDNAVAGLALATVSTASVDGGLIFNNGANTAIQVTLVVQSTYVPNLDRGESPPGLTVNASASAYAFAGVPDGKYVVLAAFGLDGDVRDVSGVGNTAAPVVTVQGGVVQGTSPSFKIIPAVDLLTIDGTAVSATPVKVTTATPAFAWKKGSVDSSALTYRVEVFDAYGNSTWSLDVAAALNDTVTYAGSALQAGMTYQLRILAIKEAIPVPASFTQLSETEDLAGVFTY